MNAYFNKRIKNLKETHIFFKQKCAFFYFGKRTYLLPDLFRSN